MKKAKRSLVVEAYLVHANTPHVTGRLADGRIRKIGRHQLFGADGWERKLAKLLATFGERWTGVREV
jgi:hypothetical protein